MLILNLFLVSVIFSECECDSIKNDSSYIEKYHSHTPCSFAYKVVCIHNKFSKKVVFFKRKNAAYQFFETILNEYSYCRGKGGAFPYWPYRMFIIGPSGSGKTNALLN